jgi:hypothetical protein
MTEPTTPAGEFWNKATAAIVFRDRQILLRSAGSVIQDGTGQFGGWIIPDSTLHQQR